MKHTYKNPKFQTSNSKQKPLILNRKKKLFLKDLKNKDENLKIMVKIKKILNLVKNLIVHGLYK